MRLIRIQMDHWRNSVRLNGRVNFGNGRVWASTCGHHFADQTEPEGMCCAAFQEIMIRALKWCAGVDPGMAVANGFPESFMRVSGRCSAMARDRRSNGDVNANFKSIPERSYRLMVSSEIDNWSHVGDVKAAVWPAESTNVTIPNALLPEGSDQRVFLKIGSLSVDE